ncbi:MAG TPA: tRNA (adenosine(37)-N6)-threonylcarbamoyltransferase complex dimerization subunit type 1 TsaB [Solirubrobacteraceae bacterium]|nr:tRNA (adenosine(37)-N6)-threonylcarbamoyltransferase complex dimerization subunit type 1 TsaB [Solirubrobacteraceae bacterium]
MTVLGLDTATASTAVGLRLARGTVFERRDDPPAGAHPGHATRLLGMVAELLEQAGGSWQEIQRIAVGVGPGTFTGLRVGVATARGLAHSRGIPLVGVSSLQALALGALDGGAGEREGEAPSVVLAVIDARRGEVFAAPYERAGAGPPRALGAAVAIAPERLTELTTGRGPDAGGWLLVGDGAERYRELLAGAGLRVAAADSPLNRISAGAICELGAGAPEPPGDGRALPDYVRRPDAELALEGA